MPSNVYCARCEGGERCAHGVPSTQYCAACEGGRRPSHCVVIDRHSPRRDVVVIDDRRPSWDRGSHHSWDRGTNSRNPRHFDGIDGRRNSVPYISGVKDTFRHYIWRIRHF